MNIFILAKDPKESAEMLYDIHVRKMLIEAVQMLSIATAFHMGSIKDTCDPYGKRHYSKFRVNMISGINKYTKSQASHPCTLWVRTCMNNAEWLVKYAYAMADEYEYRFGKEPTKVLDVLSTCVRLLRQVGELPRLAGRTKFYLAIHPEHKMQSIVGSYRKYYAETKGHLAKYTKRKEPAWLRKNKTTKTTKTNRK